MNELPPSVASPPHVSASEPHDSASAERVQASETSNRRPKQPLAALLLLAALVAVVGIAFLFLGGDEIDEANATTEVVAVKTATAEQRDLVETSTIEGTLGFAREVMVAAPAAGTLTAMIEEGELVSRNTVVAEVNALPMAAFFGDTPMYRDLQQGDEGADVAVIEANLAALGYHATTDADGELEDTGFVVDGVFDRATADAVKRWQDDLRLDRTGEVAQSSVVVLSGPSSVASTSAAVGGLVQPGAPLAMLNVESAGATFHTAHAGQIELVASGGPIRSGDVVYLVDDVPVVGILTNDRFDRDLWWGISEGNDVEILESFLVGAGYDADGDLVIDQVYDGFTAEAVEDWKDDLSDEYRDIEVSGTFRADDVISVPAGTTIEQVAELADPAPSGAELFSYSLGDTGRVVRTSIDVADQATLALGTTVDIEFPDGTVVPGTVSFVASASTSDPIDPTADPQLDVEIEIASVPDNVAQLSVLDVDIVIVDRLAAGATVVPASALVATADGGFAVELLAEGTTSFVAVTPGLFADGVVEVSGIEPGAAVVVP